MYDNLTYWLNHYIRFIRDNLIAFPTCIQSVEGSDDRRKNWKVGAIRPSSFWEVGSLRPSSFWKVGSLRPFKNWEVIAPTFQKLRGRIAPTSQKLKGRIAPTFQKLRGRSDPTSQFLKGRIAPTFQFFRRSSLPSTDWLPALLVFFKNVKSIFCCSRSTVEWWKSIFVTSFMNLLTSSCYIWLWLVHNNNNNNLQWIYNKSWTYWCNSPQYKDNIWDVLC